MSVSIIITCKQSSKELKECISSCKNLDYSDYEIIVFPDRLFSSPSQGVKMIPTGDVLPAKKRDMALEFAKGSVLAFLDDDAYPGRDWLKNAMRHFDNPDIAAVCGPAVTPDNDNLLQKASGLVYASPLVTGRYYNRYRPAIREFVDDCPSCNFIVRRGVFEKIGGFDTKFWPGEDSILCLKITKDLEKKIIYDPEVLVYHHRRNLFKEHLRQVANYALHRGYFAKRFPENSSKLAYFIPSLFVLGLILGAGLSLYSWLIKDIYFSMLLFYLFCVLVFSFNKNLPSIPLVFLGTIFTHITYGIYFLKGLVSRRLKEE